MIPLEKLENRNVNRNLALRFIGIVIFCDL